METELFGADMTGLALRVALVLVLTVLHRVGVRFMLGLWLTRRVELRFWVMLSEVLEITLVGGCGLGIEDGCKLGLLAGKETAGLGLVSVSAMVGIAATGVETSVVWALLFGGLSESNPDFGLSFPIMLLCTGRSAMVGTPALSSSWLRDVGAALRAGEASESCAGVGCVCCLSTAPVCSSASGLGC